MAATRSTTAKKAATPGKKVVVRKPRTTQTPPSVGEIDEFHAYIPAPDVAERYVGRKVHGDVWDAVLAQSALDNAENILLDGDTGAGKTLFGEALASKWQVNYYSLPCDVSVDPSALFGRMQPTDKQGIFRWQDGPVTQIVRNGGILNYSEVNFMPPKIAAASYPLLDGRRYIPLLGHEGEIVRAHLGNKGPRPCWCGAKDCNNKRVLIIADMNGKYRGTMELNAAFKNRWDHIILWGYDTEVEAKLVTFPTLREVAKQLRSMTGTELRTPCSTNMLMEFEKFAQRDLLGVDYAISNFVASFDPGEQTAVAKVLELNKSKISKDIGFLKVKSASNVPVKDEDLEEMEFDYESE